jgi:hypothetical protein
MNDLQFRQHLKALAHGHHHPEEHDWGTGARPARKADRSPAPKRAAARKTSRKK